MYICPVHSELRRSYPGKCPGCGAKLVDEASRHGAVRQLLPDPLQLGLIAAATLAIAAAALLLR